MPQPARFRSTRVASAIEDLPRFLKAGGTHSGTAYLCREKFRRRKKTGRKHMPPGPHFVGAFRESPSHSMTTASSQESLAHCRKKILDSKQWGKGIPPVQILLPPE